MEDSVSIYLPQKQESSVVNTKIQAAEKSRHIRRLTPKPLLEFSKNTLLKTSRKSSVKYMGVPENKRSKILECLLSPSAGSHANKEYGVVLWLGEWGGKKSVRS